LVVDLTRGKGKVLMMENREEYIGGSGLAAALFQKFGQPEKPWDDPDQPVIFAIGPL
jgi:aldehyde:ferredoxin oxidoreductase